MATTLSDPLIGQVVDGRYEVLSRIARGGMATVYLATDRRLDRDVALKVMHPHLAEGGTGSEFVARFRREARAAARLTHPGVVSVFDQGVDGETSYLTMELVEGTNLRRRLGDEGALTVAEALGTAERVLDALAAAHRAGLVHRDVKPENVLLATDGRVKVADFGLARAVTEVTATATGTVLGTVAYLAPELVLHGASDPRTDVYAVGILLYEMLTGEQPFTGTTPIQVAYQHVHHDVPAPSDAVTWLPAEIDELVEALAARDPVDRPPHAGAALDLVRRVHAALDDRTLARRADVTATSPEPAGGILTPDATTRLDGLGGTPDGEATAVLRTDEAVPDEDGSTSRTVALPVGGAAGEALAAPRVPGAADVDAEDASWRSRVRTVLVAVAVAAVTGIAAIWFVAWGPGAYTTVPAGAVGQTLERAVEVLEAEGLRATTENEFDPEVPAGEVIESEPAPGERVAKDGEVTLVVSDGPDLRVVPGELVGAPAEDAVARLTEAGFEVPEPEAAHHDTVPEGAVIALSAEEGQELPVGTEVRVEVSRGPAPVTVKSVVGLERAQATGLLQEDGLVVEVTEDFSEEFPAGVVMAQNPEPGAESRRTATVTLTVSKGPPLVEVPDVMRSGVEAARDALEAAGFAVDVERAGAYFGLGFVVAQDPPGGSQAPKGSTITITVT